MAGNNVRYLFGCCKQFYTSRPQLFMQYLCSYTTVKRNFPYNTFSCFRPTNHVKNNLNLGVLVRYQNTSTLENRPKHDIGCPICSRNLTFTYKDVLLLAQFLSPEGNILNRRVTGVCRKQQRKLEKAIEISRRLGLIPRKPPALSQQDKS